MGQISSALLFPETEPSLFKIASLLYFFNSISFYLPTESDAVEKNYGDFFENLCRAYTPAPLHGDLVRFNRLLREMETSRSEDLARLFSAAKAPVTTREIGDKDETSSGSVFSALQSETEMEISTERKERLWQSRLILKLAEMLDRREAEVRKGLAQVALLEQKVFSSLEGSSDVDTDDHAELPELDKLEHLASRKPGFAELNVGASALLAPLRVKAWAELFQSDPAMRRPPVLVAANADCGSILLDGCEDTWHKSPQRLFTLTIPTFSNLTADKSTKNDYLISRNRVRASAIVQLEYFEKFFNEAVAFVDPLPGDQVAILAEQVDYWNKVVESGFPAIATELKTVDFYFMPGICPTLLFQKVFQLVPAHLTTRKDYSSTILAIMQN